jgi:CRP/FNR family cyclic AMP-dependent transcriptional regulator
MTRTVPLLDAVPELAEMLDAEQARGARSALRVAVLDVPAGVVSRERIAAGGTHGFGAVVLDGLVTRHLDIGGHPALQLYGPGDLLAARPCSEVLLPVRDELTASVPTRLAVLDDRFLIAARRWPRLIPGLFRLAQDQSDRLLLQLVIAEQPKVEQRLLALFWHLADRFGHVTPEGIVLSLRLTHEALGRLVGARRPTVTLALRSLTERGAVRRDDERRWVVTDMPADVALLASPLTDGAQPVPLVASSNGSRPLAQAG